MTLFDQEKIDKLSTDIPKFIPQLSINCVIFRFYNQQLQIPVVQPIHSDLWVIPGGYIYQKESIDDAAKRIILEQIQIDNPLLNQFSTFGPADRDFRKEMMSFEYPGIPKDILNWMSQRFVTIGYYSVVGAQNIDIRSSDFFKNPKWLNIDEISLLDMDHTLLVDEARRSLSKDLLRLPVLTNLMPEKFTIPELQTLYEAILDRKIDRGNFRQRILKSRSLIKVGQRKDNSRKRPPDLYSLDKENYLNSLSADTKFGF